VTPAPHTLSALELGRAYRSGELSPVDVLQATLAHIARCEPLIHATWSNDPVATQAQALLQAQASAARWQQGHPLSLLDGVPVTIKENIATRGEVMPLGSAATPLVPAVADAPPAQRLREAGAVMVTKTTMPDFGMLSSGLSSFHQLTRNPWDLSKNPGGSSAGAGAAAAAAYGPLHLGTDIGGSVRLPANWCGVVGFKPSNGRVPIYPPYIGRVAGPLTRTVADAALMMATLCQSDVRDTTQLPHQVLGWHTLWADQPDPQHMLRGLKVGLLLDAGWGLPLDRDIKHTVQNAALLLQQAGATVLPMASFCTREMADGINRFWRLRSYLDIQKLPPAQQQKVLPFIREWVAEAASYTAAQAFEAFSQIGALRDAACSACAPFDVVLSAVAPVSAFAADWAMPTGDPLRAMEHINYTLPYNMSEQPAISVPAGHTAAGLPMGVQFAGPRHADLAVLHVARAFEQLRGPLLPWPVMPGPVLG
jgi:aspartyl-tRNA(Asn)/glutamyl-tRNA(Gln) amidotransferase subunit A